MLGASECEGAGGGGGRWREWWRGVWLVPDVCGLMCALLTWLMLLYSEYVVVVAVTLGADWRWQLHVPLYSGLLALALTSHLRAMLTDPGAVPRGTASSQALLSGAHHEGEHGHMVYKCHKCWSIKPERAHHCSVCQRCIRKMDHHCPWINNCVGENNQKYFVLFTLYVLCVAVYALTLTLLQLGYCFQNEFAECGGHSPPTTFVLLFVLFFMAVLFGIFTLVMFCSQLSAIWSDQTCIESRQMYRYKDDAGETMAASGDGDSELQYMSRYSHWRNIKTVFGPTVFAWLSPFTRPPLQSNAGARSFMC